MNKAFMNEHPYHLLHHEQTRIVGMSLVVGADQSENSRLISGLWKKFNANLWKIDNRIQRREWMKFGITFESIPGKRFAYLAGVEVTDLHSVPEGMIGKTIPEGYYAVFIHRGNYLHIKKTWFDIYKYRIAEYNLKVVPENHCGLKHFERYDKRFHWSRLNSEIDIFIPVSDIEERPALL
jgi:AraC family transcriptional regulator